MEKRNLDLSLKAKYDSGICKLFSYTIKEAKLRKLVEDPNEEGSSQIVWAKSDHLWQQDGLILLLRIIQDL